MLNTIENVKGLGEIAEKVKTLTTTKNEEKEKLLEEVEEEKKSDSKN